MNDRLYTIGHSSHSVEKVIALLKNYGITEVVDVRSQPYSRMNPQFNREALRSILANAGIAYAFLGRELGARPKDRSCYVNGTAQYDRLAQAKFFRAGLGRVLQDTHRHRIALMCAEKDPLMCHRAILVARHLVGHGLQVAHILQDGGLESHGDAVSRLLREHGLSEADLFRSAEDAANEAYARRAQQIAYREGARFDEPGRRGARR